MLELGEGLPINSLPSFRAGLSLDDLKKVLVCFGHYYPVSSTPESTVFACGNSSISTQVHEPHASDRNLLLILHLATGGRFSFPLYC